MPPDTIVSEELSMSLTKGRTARTFTCAVTISCQREKPMNPEGLELGTKVESTAVSGLLAFRIVPSFLCQRE